ncbi:SH3 domain-containing protein [Salipiger sp. 1_MG-2023]|uniref:SH3 domain-containing protein n=1 Tax=Salipiger sp. 1_MG-2023 TaxID=3062665 RepID=UPI0026E294DD|nr:SH3 domain-containing protein [Salipiger sp. 1_MG-2023]MDO6586286.1 SH3 domain-containing protein [Salipiger sp. 1_MG-2023]
MRQFAMVAGAFLLLVSGATAGATEERGAVTNLPLPRFVSLKASEANARRGPSLTHRIDWVFLRRDMPLEITAEYGHWRQVRDVDGAGGWIHYSLLSGVRTALVQKDMLELHSRAAEDTPVTAKLALGVIAELGDCTESWCELSAGGYEGWAPKTAIWGVGPDEIRN